MARLSENWCGREPMRLLVIGCGNSLRRDDGAGPRVVEMLAALDLPGVQTIVCQQLTPELADAVARSGAVVFVDAAVGLHDEVEWRPLQGEDIPRASRLNPHGYGVQALACSGPANTKNGGQHAREGTEVAGIHAATPRGILSLAWQVFGRQPQAWVVAVPAEDLGLGEGLSPRALAGVKTASAQIETFARSV